MSLEERIRANHKRLVDAMVSGELDESGRDRAIPDRQFIDGLGRRWEWCGGTEGTWAWRITAGPQEFRDMLAEFLADEHTLDDMNSRCECGWYYASPENFYEHLADAFIEFVAGLSGPVSEPVGLVPTAEPEEGK